MIFFPAIDILNGKVVRLYKGDFEQKTEYAEHPLDVAIGFEEQGITHLHLVDLDGAKSGKVVNFSAVKQICANTNLKIDFGGGVKTDDDLERLLETGVDKINIGSVAVKSPDMFNLWLQKYGPECLILSADVREGKITSYGWKENSNIELFDFLDSFINEGLTYITITDVDCDGVLAGPNFFLYQQVIEKYPMLKLTASGGIASVSHMHRLKRMGAYGAIIGKALYENKITIPELMQIS